MTSSTAAVTARAPVRVSFGGGGTDLAAYYARFGGFVVSTAIAHYCHVTAREPRDHGIEIRSPNYGLGERYRAGETFTACPAVRGALDLPKAAIAWFVQQKPALRERGVSLTLAADVPPGTGLGSSSSMAVALVTALSAYTGVKLDTAGIAELACWLEIERLGMPIGKQDQYASAFGGLNTIVFTASGVRVAPLGLTHDVAAALSSRLMLFSTGQSHHSGEILNDQQTDIRDVKPAVINSLDRIKSLAEEMCDALATHDLDGFGRLLDLGWQQKRRLSDKVSTDQIDTWYAAALDAGALGGKITGAGGGGFLLLYCPPSVQRSVRAVMARYGLRELRFDFDFTGASLVRQTPAHGKVNYASPWLGQ